jgi:hypothetical protein
MEIATRRVGLQAGRSRVRCREVQVPEQQGVDVVVVWCRGRSGSAQMRCGHDAGIVSVVEIMMHVDV